MFEYNFAYYDQQDFDVIIILSIIPGINIISKLYSIMPSTQYKDRIFLRVDTSIQYIEKYRDKYDFYLPKYRLRRIRMTNLEFEIWSII